MMTEVSKTKTINETPVLRRLGAFVWAALSANKATVAALGLLLGSGLTALANDNRAPEVPDERLAVDDGFKVNFHGFGVGVQIYTWNGTDWGKAVPRATLFDDEGNVVASHFAGPRWMSNSGSTVLGTVVFAATVNPNAIPWVKLSATFEGGAGIFANTKFIQRVNTVGGKEPSENGDFVGQVFESPYTADYFFYRAE
jgi:hypothetical protein